MHFDAVDSAGGYFPLAVEGAEEGGVLSQRDPGGCQVVVDVLLQIMATSAARTADPGPRTFSPEDSPPAS